jgi:hypothetical protein
VPHGHAGAGRSVGGSGEPRVGAGAVSGAVGSIGTLHPRG